MEIMIVTVLAALAFSPLLLAYSRHQSGRSPKGAMAVNIVAVFALCLLTTGMGIGGHAMAAAEQGAAAASSSAGWGYLAMALSTGLACIGGGIAVSAAASAALGAISEDGSILGKSLIFVGLAEGVCLYGLIISFMIIGRL